ncbi:MAG TPA: nucleoside recognition protein [Clostridiaceae bacterium]|jgi:spore maturation protein A|nr:nucleoside recognition protein [Clostridiaceae bacterium]
MLNVIWPIFIIISFIYAFLVGRVDDVNQSIFDSAASAVELSITFLGTMCLWNGVMKIVQETSLIEKLTKLLRPIMKFLFPNLKDKDTANKEISMNLIANILGLGNAATPLGLKAMKTMQKENEKKDTLSNSMAMFIVLNTASLQLVPTTVIAIRSSLGSENPSSIILPIWIVSIITVVTGVCITKILMKKF